MGYGGFMKFDHDFIGSEALQKMSNAPHRHKVTLALDDGDVTRVIGSMFQKNNRTKFMDWPSAVYSMHPFDRVMVDGETVGVSTWVGYSANEGKMLTLAVLDADYAEPGDGSDVPVGRGERRHQEADRRAPHADADAGDRQPGAVCRSGAQGLCAGWLAGGFGVGARLPIRRPSR